MFCIHAIFDKTHLKEILEDLIENNLPGITILEAFPKGLFEVKENTHPTLDENKKVKIEVVVANEKIKLLVIEIITNVCMDLGYGAGKIWITKVEEVIRIRTGERNEDALIINKNNNAKYKNQQEVYFSSTDTPSS